MKSNLISLRLRQIRMESKPKVTQSDLVARLQTLGVYMDETMISKIEMGKRGVSDIELVALAKALKIPVNGLLSDLLEDEEKNK